MLRYVTARILGPLISLYQQYALVPLFGMWAFLARAVSTGIVVATAIAAVKVLPHLAGVIWLKAEKEKLERDIRQLE